MKVLLTHTCVKKKKVYKYESARSKCKLRSSSDVTNLTQFDLLTKLGIVISVCLTLALE